MTTMIQPRAKQSSEPNDSTSKRTVLTGHSRQGIPRSGEAEPPEEALEFCEAPERGQAIQEEAPDAGDGRNYHDDRELKHGRSRG